MDNPFALHAAPFGHCDLCANSSLLFDKSCTGGRRCIVAGVPRECITPDPRPPWRCVSNVKTSAVRDVMTIAPASSAARATAAFVVSIEIGMVDCFRHPLNHGKTRLNLFFRGNNGSAAGGRFDSPPTSMMSAPSAISCSACASAFGARKRFPSLSIRRAHIEHAHDEVRAPWGSCGPLFAFADHVR